MVYYFLNKQSHLIDVIVVISNVYWKIHVVVELLSIPSLVLIIAQEICTDALKLHWSSEQGSMVDALALSGDERRDYLR